MKRISWPMTVVVGVIVVGAVVAGIYGPDGLWQGLVGLAVGLFPRAGVIGGAR